MSTLSLRETDLTTVESFFQQELEKDLLRLVTAGSVDDGKSTLIGRLLYDSQSVYEDQLHAVHRASQTRNNGNLDLSLACAPSVNKASPLTSPTVTSPPTSASSFLPIHRATCSTRAIWPPAPRMPTSPSCYWMPGAEFRNNRTAMPTSPLCLALPIW